MCNGTLRNGPFIFACCRKQRAPCLSQSSLKQSNWLLGVSYDNVSWSQWSKVIFSERKKVTFFPKKPSEVFQDCVLGLCKSSEWCCSGDNMLNGGGVGSFPGSALLRRVIAQENYFLLNKPLFFFFRKPVLSPWLFLKNTSSARFGNGPQ